MTQDLQKTIERYSDELFADLNNARSISEDEKADIYARIQEHIHQVILQTITPIFESTDTSAIRDFLDREDYGKVGALLKSKPQAENLIDSQIVKELDYLKDQLNKELEN